MSGPNGRHDTLIPVVVEQGPTIEELRDRLAERERRIAELEQQVGIDTLTNLPRRTVLIAQARVYESRRRPFAVLFFDLDGFKRVNDTHGHEAGDSLLVRAADCLRAVREADGDMVARWGGDEFVVLVRDPYETEFVAQRLRQDVFDAVCSHGAGCSVGVAHCPRDAATFEGALDVADRRMLAAKIARRNAAQNP